MRSYEDFVKVLDSVFKRDDIRGIWETELDGSIAWYVGHAFVNILRSPGESSVRRIAIGRDMREG